MHLEGRVTAWLCILNIKRESETFLPLSESTVISCSLEFTQCHFSRIKVSYSKFNTQAAAFLSISHQDLYRRA